MTGAPGLTRAAALCGALLLGCGPAEGGDGKKPRIASLSSQDWQSRVDKVDVLAESRNQESLALLIRAMNDEHPRVREAAIKALAVREDRTAIPSFASDSVIPRKYSSPAWTSAVEESEPKS